MDLRAKIFPWMTAGIRIPALPPGWMVRLLTLYDQPKPIGSRPLVLSFRPRVNAAHSVLQLTGKKPPIFRAIAMSKPRRVRSVRARRSANIGASRSPDGESVAQAEGLAFGKTADELAAGACTFQIPFRVMEGNRPTSIILADAPLPRQPRGSL
jgi:hypothetical protein